MKGITGKLRAVSNRSLFYPLDVAQWLARLTGHPTAAGSMPTTAQACCNCLGRAIIIYISVIQSSSKWATDNRQLDYANGCSVFQPLANNVLLLETM